MILIYFTNANGRSLTTSLGRQAYDAVGEYARNNWVLLNLGKRR